jgi:hypothetical protein
MSRKGRTKSPLICLNYLYRLVPETSMTDVTTVQELATTSTASTLLPCVWQTICLLPFHILRHHMIEISAHI